MNKFKHSHSGDNKLVPTQQTFVGLQDMSSRRLQDVSEANKMFTGDICN